MIRLAVFSVVVILAISSTCSQAQGTKNLIDVYTESVFNYAVLNNRKPVVVYFGNE